MPNKIIKALQENYVLVLIFLLAAVLRFFHLDFQSPWLDEIHTLNESNPHISLSDLYGQIITGEQMPPLYFYLLYFIFKIFGHSIFVARFFSALVGLLSVYSIYLLAKEITNSKKTAVLATLFLGLNYFMIYYSQDARPYMFFTLFVILSYYRMVCYLNNPTMKNALIYAFFTSLMLHCHFVGFFTLFAQGITVILYLIYSKEINKKSFFKYCTIILLIIIITYIPAVDALISILEMKEFWIPMPGKDAFQSIYESFFGNSEIVIFINFIFFIGFIYSILKSFDDIKEKKALNPWSLIILILWISLSILIPVIRSYTSNPIILDRYFISILPAIIIILAIGLQSFNNKLVTNSILGLYIVFCLVDILVVKKYYWSVNKAQFREATTYIIENNDNNDKVVSSLSWYLPYFFERANKDYTVVGSTLDDFVSRQIQNDSELSSFWYFDGHDRTYNPSQLTADFLTKNFTVEHNYSGFQAWTRHYVVKKGENLIMHFSDQELRDLISNQDFMNNIENFNYQNNNLSINGWALLRDLNSKNTKIQLVLLDGTVGYKIETLQVLRPDVTSYFKLDYNADYSGFETSVSLDNIPSGNYTLGILLKNEVDNKSCLFYYDKKINVL